MLTKSQLANVFRMIIILSDVQSLTGKESKTSVKIRRNPATPRAASRFLIVNRYVRSQL